MYEDLGCLFQNFINDIYDSVSTSENLREFFILTFTNIVSKVVLFQQLYVPYSQISMIHRLGGAKIL